MVLACLYFLVGFVFVVLFIPKESSTVGIHSVVLSAICFWLIFLFKRAWLPNRGRGAINRIKSICVTCLIFIIFSFFSVGYLLALNGLLGVQEIVCSKGTVVNKFKDESKLNNKNYYIDFVPEGGNEYETIRVSLSEFQNYKVGDEIEKSWKRGLLGYTYVSAFGTGVGTVRYKGCY